MTKQGEAVLNWRKGLLEERECELCLEGLGKFKQPKWRWFGLSPFLFLFLSLSLSLQQSLTVMNSWAKVSRLADCSAHQDNTL